MTARIRKRFSDRVVIITGGSSGIGLSTASLFALEGARLVLAARHTGRLREAADKLKAQGGNNILTVVCDVSKRPEVDDLMTQAAARFGRIDILVNNAAVGIIGPLEVVQLDDARALFETNFFGTFNCCQAVLPYMKRQAGGQIINVASLAGLRGIPNAIYSASKAAVISLSETLRLEVEPFGITVTVLCPGRVAPSETSFFDSAKKYGSMELASSPSLLTAEQVGRVLLDAASKRQRLVVFPFHARFLHTLNKFSPRLADCILRRHMPKPGNPATAERSGS